MKSKQAFYVIIGVGLVLLGGLGAGYYYETGRVKTQTETLKRLQADDMVAGQKLDQLGDLKKQFSQLQPVLVKLNLALPSQKNQSEVILQIQQLAQTAGMALPSASFQASTGLPNATSQTIRAGDVLALPISFQLSGSYAQLQTFLQQMEQLGRYNTVSALAISHGNGSKLAFSITLTVYVKP